MLPRRPFSRGTFELSRQVALSRMSVQILLQGKFLGVEDFLPAGQPAESLLTGRLRWVSLLSEILPRALIAELGLSRMLLGSSGGEQFLVVLPEEVRPQVEDFLAGARAGIRELSQNRLELLWAITENLGDWTVVRKRLNDEFQRKQGTPLASTGFSRTQIASAAEADPAYFENLGRTLRDAIGVGWSPESPATIWLLPRAAENIPGPSALRLIRCRWRATPRLPTTAANRHGSGAGNSRRGSAGVGSPQRRRGQLRHPDAAAAKHRRVRAAFGAIQTVLRR